MLHSPANPEILSVEFNYCGAEANATSVINTPP
jgi:hypothetical protein